MCYPDKLSPAGEVSQNVTVNATQIKSKRGGQKGNRHARKHGFYSGTLSPAQTSQLWNITNREGVDPEIALIRQPPRLANRKGKATKRIVCILRVKCAGGNRSTYEKELLNFRKNSSFYKTNHPGLYFNN